MTPIRRRIRRRFWFGMTVIPVSFASGFLPPLWADLGRVYMALWAGTGVAWWIVFPLVGDQDGRRGYFRYAWDGYQGLKADERADSAHTE